MTNRLLYIKVYIYSVRLLDTFEYVEISYVFVNHTISLTSLAEKEIISCQDSGYSNIELVEALSVNGSIYQDNNITIQKSFIIGSKAYDVVSVSKYFYYDGSNTNEIIFQNTISEFNCLTGDINAVVVFDNIGFVAFDEIQFLERGINCSWSQFKLSMYNKYYNNFYIDENGHLEL